MLFGEPLPYDMLARAQEAALSCEVMLIVGTSLEVMPAADLPLLAKRRGARLILINRSSTPLDDQMDVIVRADVVEALRAYWRRGLACSSRPQSSPPRRAPCFGGSFWSVASNPASSCSFSASVSRADGCMSR